MSFVVVATTLRIGLVVILVSLAGGAADPRHHAVDPAALDGCRAPDEPGCASCCVDELTVFEVEAARIATFAADVLRQAPGPVGACAFLDESKSCRIYEHRPYVCRTQGLPLRWVEQRRGRIVERRDACTLNFQDLSVHSLPKDDCWSLGPVEARLLALQDRVDGGAERRIALRDLFEAPPPAEHAP